MTNQHKQTNHNLILSIYPNSQGFGYCVAENFKELIDYGVVKISPVSNPHCLKRFDKFLDYYKPQVVVIRNIEMNSSKRSKRLSKLFESMIAVVHQKELELHSYANSDVKNVFEQFKAVTKYQISKAIARWYPQLRKKAPKVRKIWEAEQYSQSYFDAIALLITHLYLQE